jgi:hypothetical protein
MKLVRPRTHVKPIVFDSFSEGVDFSAGVSGGQYYDSLAITGGLKFHQPCIPVTAG